MTVTNFNIFQQITSVRLASVANYSGVYNNGQINNGVGATLLSSSVGALVVDGVNANVGDRILLKDQTNANENGIYIVRVAGSAIAKWLLERSGDFQSIEQLKVGQYFSVGAGNTFAGSIFVLCEPLPSVVGLGTFNFVDVSAGINPPAAYFAIANNLSESTNKNELFANIGLGGAADLIIDESDFVGGEYQLTNPCPGLIFVNATSPGNVIKLPAVDEPQSFLKTTGPVFFIQDTFEQVEIQDINGLTITTLPAPTCTQLVLDDNASPEGLWFVRSFVSTINGFSGDVVLTGSDIDADYPSPTNYTPVDSTIKGNLEGINNALSAIPSVVRYTEIYVSATQGSDIVSSGSPIQPYQTLDYAISQITPSSQVYIIKCYPGSYTSTNLTLKPNVIIDLNGSSLVASGTVSLNSAWTGSTGICGIINGYGVSLPISTLLNFELINASAGVFLLTNNVFSSNCNFGVSGLATSGPVYIQIANNRSSSGDINYSFYNCIGLMQNNDCNSALVYKTNGSSSSSFLVQGNTIRLSFQAINGSNFQYDLFVKNNTFKADISYTTTGAGILNVKSSGSNAGTTLTLDGPNVQFDPDVIIDLPILDNGAVFNPTVIANGMDANYSTAVNYVPIDTSVAGQFPGIDNALGQLGSRDLQDTYSSGNTADIVLEANRPISIINAASSSVVNAITTPSTGINTVANNRVLGWTFIPSVNMSVTALQYDAALFPSPQTRETGIYVKSTQELLGSVNIAQTDPLDSTNTFRTKVLDAPIQLTAGVAYVFATVTPAGNSDHSNADAVPDANITITERAELPATSLPLALSFPQQFTVVSNYVHVGSFQYAVNTDSDTFSVNDPTTSLSTFVEVSSTSKGSIPAPKMTVAQRNAISSPSVGLTVIVTDLSPPRYSVWDGSIWQDIYYASDASSGSYALVDDPVNSFAINSFSSVSSFYQKIGNIVSVWGRAIVVPAASSSLLAMNALFMSNNFPDNLRCSGCGAVALGSGPPTGADGAVVNVESVAGAQSFALNLMIPAANGTDIYEISFSISYEVQ